MQVGKKFINRMYNVNYK